MTEDRKTDADVRQSVEDVGGATRSSERTAGKDAAAAPSTSRRQFALAALGTIAGITIIGSVGARDAFSQCGPTCGSGTPDAGCGGGNTDENCGGGDVDNNCGATDVDNNCGVGGDPDNDCGASSTDAGCNTSDVDNHCRASNWNNAGDAGCGGAGGGYDPDTHCGFTVGDVDNGCGCGGGTDTDDNCVKNAGDHDANCDAMGDPDASCNAHYADEGCGTPYNKDYHCGEYGTGGVDVDNACRLYPGPPPWDPDESA